MSAKYSTLLIGEEVLTFHYFILVNLKTPINDQPHFPFNTQKVVIADQLDPNIGNVNSSMVVTSFYLR
jgi:hypothetical protein